MKRFMFAGKKEVRIRIIKIELLALKKILTRKKVTVFWPGHYRWIINFTTGTEEKKKFNGLFTL